MYENAFKDVGGCFSAHCATNVSKMYGRVLHVYHLPILYPCYIEQQKYYGAHSNKRNF